MTWSYAWRTSLVNPSCPSARCVAPLTDPVPNARRVTLTPDFPSVTQSVAVPRAARKGRPPVPARTPAANPVFKKLRLEQNGIVALRLAISYHESGPYGEGIPDSQAASVMPRTTASCSFYVGQDGILRRVGNPPGAPVGNRRAACQAAPQSKQPGRSAAPPPDPPAPLATPAHSWQAPRPGRVSAVRRQT